MGSILFHGYGTMIVVFFFLAAIRRCSSKQLLLNLAKLTEKYLCIAQIFCRPATSLKKRIQHKCFPASFAKFSRTAFLIEHPRQRVLFFQRKYKI